MKKPLTKVEQQALSRFRDALQSWLGENLISMRLFGSRARGEQTEESDIDVLVLVQKKDRALCRRIIEESLEVDLTYGINLSPTILSADEYRQNQEYGTPFYHNVEREGIAL
jgi:predicted nucleotidyltransferase